MDWELRVTGILLVLVAMAMAVVSAQSADPSAGSHASSHATEPIWMILSGAALLIVASAVRRLTP